MRVRGVATVRDLMTRRLVTWEPTGALGLQVPEDLRETARQDRQTIEAVRRRAAVFARQLAVPSPDPFLRYRDQRWCGEGCPSCGIGLRAHERWRCDLCSVAAELALAAPAVAEQVER